MSKPYSGVGGTQSVQSMLSSKTEILRLLLRHNLGLFLWMCICSQLTKGKMLC